MMSRIWRLLLVGWLVLSLLNCASAPTPAPAQTPGEPTYGGEYIIGPDDSLEVFVWHHPELCATVEVRPDGKISTPLVEDMVATGKTPPRLARDVEKALSEHMNAPKVNIIVAGGPGNVGNVSQVKVVGQVAHPQALLYRDGMRVLDAIRGVGGLTQSASGNRARIVRTENGKQTIIHVKVADLVNSGDVKQNIPLEPGDVLVVPQSIF